MSTENSTSVILPPTRIIWTKDGSPTLYRSDIDEHFHSTFGAFTESEHVYIQNGLRYRASLDNKQPLIVFEVGFGTGLNAVLTAQSGLSVCYYAIEKFPLPSEVADSLNFGPTINPGLLSALHQAPWDTSTRITPSFNLHKIKGDFTESVETINNLTADVIFMDAFAPEKQPEMWSETILSRLVDMLNPGGVITTYCAKGYIRRYFQKLGLIAHRLPGPIGGKREILRLVKPLNQF